MTLYAPPTAGKSTLQPDVDTDDVILDYLRDEMKITDPTHKDWMPLSTHETRCKIFELAKKKLKNGNGLLVTNFTDVPADIAFRFESNEPLAVRWYELGRHDFFNWLLTPASSHFNVKAPIQVYLGEGCFVGDVIYSDLKKGEYHVRKYGDFVLIVGPTVHMYHLQGQKPIPLSGSEYQSRLAKRDNFASKERSIEDIIYNLHSEVNVQVLDEYFNVKSDRSTASLITAALFMSADNSVKEEYLLRFASSPEGKRKSMSTGIRGDVIMDKGGDFVKD